MPSKPFDDTQGKGHRPKLTNKELTGHKPVLLHEVLEQLSVQPNDIVVDATLGGAGHAREISDLLGANGVFIGFDLDENALDRARETLGSVQPKVILIEANFRDLAEELAKRGISKVAEVLFDLGWSSYQLGSGRGFSFMADEPLRMTYSRTKNDLTAATIVNEWGEKSLADVIFGWGGERYARRIARSIVEARARKPIQTSRELADVIRDAVPAAYRRGKIHPATRTFQALRIAVNDELDALKEGLETAWHLLAPRGRIAVITFHSLEDRIVKKMFNEFEKSGEGMRITKKPIIPSAEEVRENPRSRSAKLRVIEKIIASH